MELTGGKIKAISFSSACCDFLARFRSLDFVVILLPKLCLWLLSFALCQCLGPVTICMSCLVSVTILLWLCHGFVVISFWIVDKVVTLFWKASRREGCVWMGGGVVFMCFVILRGAPLCLVCVSMWHAKLLHVAQVKQ